MDRENIEIPFRIEYKIEKEELMKLILNHLSKQDNRIKKYNVKGICFCEDYRNKLFNDGKFYYILTAKGDNQKFKQIKNECKQE